MWLDYSGYSEFSPTRKEVYLTLKDGGFGDADGIENGIIVDPLAFGSNSDPKSDSSDSSDSPIDELFGGIIPDDISCFIGTTAGRHPPLNFLQFFRQVNYHPVHSTGWCEFLRYKRRKAKTRQCFIC